MQLYPDVAPVTVNNFLDYVNSRFYTNTLFHRVIPGFVIQGGGYTTGMEPKTRQNAPIVLESSKGQSNTRGMVAMARTAALNSATSEFFVNVADTIAAVPTGFVGAFQDVPLTDVVIQLAVQTK